MTFDNVTYPHVSLPVGTRLRNLWSGILRYAAAAVHAESMPTVEEEFGVLVRRENATISKICFAYSGSVAEFDDLRQDALINIWRGMKRFRGEATHRTWIYRVTVNSCLSTIRRQMRHRHESLESLYDLIDPDDVSKRESIEQMHRAINTLGAQEKAIIMMWLDELSYEEIAASMGMNRNTVATKIRRIKDKITKKIK